MGPLLPEKHKESEHKILLLKTTKDAKVSPYESVATFVVIVKPILENACQVWHPGLTQKQHECLEKKQERALKIVMPNLQYVDALKNCKIPSLKST